MARPGAGTSARTWWIFGLTCAVALLLTIGVAVHVALRWEPAVVAHVEAGEWMEFETFRIRVEHAEIADSFPGSFDDEVKSKTEGMRLMLVRLHVQRFDEPPEDWADDLDAVCTIRVFSGDGLRMEDDGYSEVAGPIPGSCVNGTSITDVDQEWGDEMDFKSQRVVSVAPDPLASFTLQVQHLRGSDRDHVWTSALA